MSEDDSEDVSQPRLLLVDDNEINLRVGYCVQALVPCVNGIVLTFIENSLSRPLSSDTATIT
jgi:hypothetical protein